MSLCCRISYMAVRCSICICCRVHTPGALTEVINEDAERTFIETTGDKPLPGGRRVDTWSMCFQGGTFDRVKERCVASLSIAVRRAYVCVYHTLSSARHPIVCRLDAYRTYQTMSVAVACMSSTLSGAPVTSPSARSPNTLWGCLGCPIRWSPRNYRLISPRRKGRSRLGLACTAACGWARASHSTRHTRSSRIIYECRIYTFIHSCSMHIRRLLCPVR